MNKKNKPFSFIAFDQNQKLKKGIILARTNIEAKIKLQAEGLKIKKINSLFFLKSKPLSYKIISIFTRQLSTLLNAGVPLLNSLSIIEKNNSSIFLKHLIQSIKKNIEQGFSLSQTLKKYPEFFDSFFCDLVYAGENSGKLNEILNQIIFYREKIQNIKQKVKKALTYPLIVLVVAFLVSSILLIKVIPQFESIFNNAGKNLPLFTQLVIALSHFLRTKGLLILTLFSTITLIITEKTKKTKSWRVLKDKLLLKLPLIGTLVQKSCIGRFCRVLSSTFSAGLPLNKALILSASASDHSLYETAILNVEKKVNSGHALSYALSQENLFPAMMVQMINIGEETGTLDAMIEKIALIYEEEINESVDHLGQLIEPLLMTILGCIVGALVIAMYLPIFKLGTAF